MDNTKNNESKDNKWYIIIVLLIILIFLFILSLLILVIRIGNFLPNGTDIFFIEPKEAEFIVEDDKTIWSDETSIEIFAISKINGEGKMTVLSGTGDNIIAPGMEGNYKFILKNMGNIAIDYSCNIVASLKGKNITIDEKNIPFKIRLKDYQNNYIIGNDNNGDTIGELKKYVDSKTIGKNCYVYYELEWCWPYESGNDEFDTLLGNMSSESQIDFVIDISFKAVQSEKLNASGGIKFNNKDPRTGGNIVPIPYIVLNLLILIILIILIILKKRKKDEENEDNSIEVDNNNSNNNL